MTAKFDSEWLSKQKVVDHKRPTKAQVSNRVELEELQEKVKLKIPAEGPVKLNQKSDIGKAITPNNTKNKDSFTAELKVRTNQKQSKYNNKPVIVDGIKFQSTKEGNRYSELRLLEKAKEIKWLQLQIPFEFALNGVKIASYRADFIYLNKKGETIVEDCKGFKTAVYRLKKKMMLAFHGVTILES